MFLCVFSVIAFRRGNVVGINVTATLLSGRENEKGDGPRSLRAAVDVAFEYCNTTSAATTSLLLSSESRAAAVSAVLAASGIPSNGDGDKTTTAPTAQSNEDLRELHLLYLVDFGSC